MPETDRNNCERIDRYWPAPGPQISDPGEYRDLDTVQVAERIVTFRDKHSPNAIVVDGDGIGAGVVDQLQHRGYTKGLFEFHGGERPRDFHMYFNRRSEVWGLMRNWFHKGSVEVPNDPELEVDLTGLSMDSRPRTRFNSNARKI